MRRLIMRKTLIVISALIFSCLFFISVLFGNSAPERISFSPAETSEVLNNPYMGLVADARDTDIEQPVRLAHANAFWRDIEPNKGQFDFERFEQTNHFDKWRQDNVKIVLRIILDYPGPVKHMDIPDWLYNEIGGRGSWYNNDYGVGFSPDYTNAALISYHDKLLQAFGDRYTDDPLIAFVELGSIGHWGEWHTWDSDPNRIPFPKHAVSDRYAAAYVRNFPDKLLLMRRPTEIARKYGMGLFNDAFGKTNATVDGFLSWFTSGYVSWLTGEKEPAMPDFWAKAPSGGEFSDPVKYVSASRIGETLRQAKLTHVSWLGPSAPVYEQLGGSLQESIDLLLKTIGYRFIIAKVSHEKQIKAGGQLHVELGVTNRGVAPFYFQWPVELSLWSTDNLRVAVWPVNWDIRKWLSGASKEKAVLAIPVGLPSGDYTMRMAILDPETGKSGIRFANESLYPDDGYDISTVQIAE
ncbi:DUF4832 domain-containing protein [Cohnella suwonensis]|uniref:DUF4832 domain-containing protein n=1 Tax=Cohnella suwonensis TaxID=696072 RepID=A0ABW0LWX7_9BACL